MIRNVSAFFVAIAFATLTAASAQYVPQGSYLQSCTNVQMGNAGVLFALCPSPSGARISSTINVNACNGSDIANINGYLRCNGGGGNPGYGVRLPNGSYQASCINATLRGSMLSAACSSPNGSRPYSRLDVNQCGSADIQNANGYLACGAGGGYNGYNPNGGQMTGALPNGSYQMSCTNAYTNYGRLTATCPTSNGSRLTTWVNLGRCRPGTDIANINGHLECMNYR